MSQGMSALADRKDYAGVLRLVEYILAFARQKAGTPIARCRATCALRARYTAHGLHRLCPDVRTRSGSAPSLASSHSRFLRSTNILTGPFIEVLRTAFELYQRDDLSSDLIAPFSPAGTARRQRLATRSIAGLALSSLLWWGRRTRGGDRRAREGRRRRAARVGASA